MKLLLDTHVFLWLNNDSKQLSQTVKALFNSGEHTFYLSIVSTWEIQIKSQLGKLSLPMTISELVDKNRVENNIQLVPIELTHISYLEQLPQSHKDPFDRLIIAQAVIDGMTILTADRAFSDYSVSVIW